MSHPQKSEVGVITKKPQTAAISLKEIFSVAKKGTDCSNSVCLFIRGVNKRRFQMAYIRQSPQVLGQGYAFCARTARLSFEDLVSLQINHI